MTKVNLLNTRYLVIRREAYLVILPYKEDKKIDGNSGTLLTGEVIDTPRTNSPLSVHSGMIEP